MSGEVGSSLGRLMPVKLSQDPPAGDVFQSCLALKRKTGKSGGEIGGVEMIWSAVHMQSPGGFEVAFGLRNSYRSEGLIS